VVNNTETLSNVPQILEHGADWFRSIGTPKSTGTKVFSVSGHVRRPGNYEAPLGTSFAEILERAGGMLDGRELKAVLPAGASSWVLTADQVRDLSLDWESVADAGAQLGSASLIVIAEGTDMAWVAGKTTRFFEHESCGKCSPCREGLFWLSKVYGRVLSGNGRPGDAELLAGIVQRIEGKCFCPLGEFALAAPQSTLQAYAEEYPASEGQ
jgi:NADH-quinone oxidoreductase subunit F